MSGGKGGSQTTKVEIPKWLESAAQKNMARADEIAQLGYTPYYGPDVAAFTPAQEAAFANAASAANAFGMAAPTASNMPTPETFAGGIRGYSSGSLYDQALQEMQARSPGQFNAITGMFIDPRTGAAPRNPAFAPNAVAPAGAAAPSTSRVTRRYNPEEKD